MYDTERVSPSIKSFKSKSIRLALGPLHFSVASLCAYYIFKSIFSILNKRMIW